MKTLPFLAVILAAGSLAAQSPAYTLDKRVMLFGEYSQTEQFVVASTSADIKDRADAQKGLGLRFMGELPGTLNWYYEFGGRLESSENLKVNGPDGTAGGWLDTRDVAIKYSYWMLGLGYEMELGSVVNLGFHLEGRGEALGAKGEFFDAARNSLGAVNQSVTYLRPWARVSLTFNFKAGDVRSFVGIEGAAAITKTSQQRVESTYISERTLKAMAPKVSGAIYAGIRF